MSTKALLDVGVWAAKRLMIWAATSRLQLRIMNLTTARENEGSETSNGLAKSGNLIVKGLFVLVLPIATHKDIYSHLRHKFMS